MLQGALRASGVRVDPSDLTDESDLAAKMLQVPDDLRQVGENDSGAVTPADADVPGDCPGDFGDTDNRADGALTRVDGDGLGGSV
jgi:hypothetical protein